jgi:hypothetical protein
MSKLWAATYLGGEIMGDVLDGRRLEDLLGGLFCIPLLYRRQSPQQLEDTVHVAAVAEVRQPNKPDQNRTPDDQILLIHHPRRRTSYLFVPNRHGNKKCSVYGWNTDCSKRRLTFSAARFGHQARGELRAHGKRHSRVQEKVCHFWKSWQHSPRAKQGLECRSLLGDLVKCKVHVQLNLQLCHGLLSLLQSHAIDSPVGKVNGLQKKQPQESGTF